MNDFTEHDSADRVIRCAVVMRVREDECDVLREGRLITAQFAKRHTRPSPPTLQQRPAELGEFATSEHNMHGEHRLGVVPTEVVNAGR